jgi:uncharacterized protein with GYD domain
VPRPSRKAKKIGVGVKDIYWTLGSHDVVVICEAPDDESASALALSVSMTPGTLQPAYGK